MPQPRPRRRRDTPRRPVAGIAGLPDIKFAAAEVNAVVGAATRSVAKTMGVTVAQLSSDVKAAIKTATINALNVRAKAIIQRDVDTAVKSKVLAGVSALQMLDDRVMAASQGIAQIAGDAKVDAVLADTAKLLWKKYNALKTAGFTPTQAFDLLHAEVQGRASR